MKKSGKIIALILIVIIIEIIFIALELNFFNNKNTDESEYSSTVSDVTVSYEPEDVSSDVVESEDPEEVSSEPEEEPDLNQYATVTADSVVIREKSSKLSKKLGTLHKGDKVIVTETNGSWSKINFNGKVGWISTSCLELIRNRDLEATLYSPIPEAEKGEIKSLENTATQVYLEKIAEQYHATAINVAVIKDGNVAYTMDYGYADLKNKVEVNEDTKYRIASLSKVFTAMNAMTLVDKGEISLDGDISEISGYYTRNPYHPDEKITMRMLLTHTSTLKDGDKAFTAYPWSRLNKKTYYLSNKPGTKFSYSNFAVGYAAAAIEVKSNMLISDYANSTFLNDMGIDASYDGSKLKNKKLVANLYSGKTLQRSANVITQKQTETTPGKTFHLGAGGLIISAKDYAKLITILINDGIYNGKEYLSKESVDEMLTVQLETELFDQCIALRYKENYFGNRSVYYHTGSVYGLHALVMFDKSDNSGVVVLTSGASGTVDDINVYEVCKDIAELCYDDILGGF